MAKSNAFQRSLLAFGLAAAVTMAGIPGAEAADVLSATPSTIAGATLAVTPTTAASPPGVSPDVFFDDTTGTYYLYTTNAPAKAYTSSDGVNWTESKGAQLPAGFDWSVVKMGPNNYRMYYASMTNKPGVVACADKMKALSYATSTDLLNWTAQPGSLVEDLGCGVPHVLRKPDGTFLLYNNTFSPQGKLGMNISTSTDGLSWTLAAFIQDCNLGDPAPLMMPDGTYLMISSAVCLGQQDAQIYSSPNGLDWTHRSSALLVIPGVSFLDPSVELVNGKLRVWFGYAPGGDHAKSVIANGALTLGSTASKTSNKPGTACTKAGAKAKYNGKVVVCTKTKGKLVWVRVD